MYSNRVRLKEGPQVDAAIRDAAANAAAPLVVAFLLWFAKVLRKSKLSEPPARRHLFYENAFITTKNKSYFIKLVNKIIK